MNVGDYCWRDAFGVAALSLPWRVILPDGTTRTDPSQWSVDADVMAATGWTRSTLTEEDVAALTPPPPPSAPAWQTPAGWSLGMTPDDVARLTGLYLLAMRRSQLGLGDAVSVWDVSGERHEMTFSEFDGLMLAYGAAVEAANAP